VGGPQNILLRWDVGFNFWYKNIVWSSATNFFQNEQNKPLQTLRNKPLQTLRNKPPQTLRNKPPQTLRNESPAKCKRCHGSPRVGKEDLIVPSVPISTRFARGGGDWNLDLNKIVAPLQPLVQVSLRGHTTCGFMQM
jgi:hypothetical protein